MFSVRGFLAFFAFGSGEGRGGVASSDNGHGVCGVYPVWLRENEHLFLWKMLSHHPCTVERHLIRS